MASINHVEPQSSLSPEDEKHVEDMPQKPDMFSNAATATGQYHSLANVSSLLSGLQTKSTK